MQARFVQTISALAGVGSLFNLVSVPLQNQIQAGQQAGQISGELYMLLLFFMAWNLAAVAHIFRESFNVRLLAAFILTLAYMAIEISVNQILFPELRS